MIINAYIHTNTIVLLLGGNALLDNVLTCAECHIATLLCLLDIEHDFIAELAAETLLLVLGLLLLLFRFQTTPATRSLKKNLKASRPSEHPPVRGEKCQ